jgi:hypothetical protein
VSSDNSTFWQLRRNDRKDINAIAADIIRLAKMAERGEQLIAIGEAWKAIENILDGEPIEVDLQIHLEAERTGDDGDFQYIVGISMQSDSIRLFARSIPSDGSMNVKATDFAKFTPDGNFDMKDGLYHWSVEMNDICNENETKLTTRLSKVWIRSGDRYIPPLARL